MIEQTKRYICECGREFTTPNSFNGHKSSCKTHLIAVGKPVDKINVYNPEIQAKAHATLAKRCAEKREQRLLSWISEEHTCEKCGKVMTELYGTGRFCSRSCANSRKHSDETRDKLSKATKAFVEKRISSDPQAIRVAKVKKEPTNLLELSKRTISKIVLRMELPCSCCGIYIPGVVWDLHHIKPKKLGGNDTAENLTYICPNCHRICHTDTSILPKPLVSLKDFLPELGKRWQDYYFAKTSNTD